MSYWLEKEAVSLLHWCTIFPIKFNSSIINHQIIQLNPKPILIPSWKECNIGPSLINASGNEQQIILTRRLHGKKRQFLSFWLTFPSLFSICMTLTSDEVYLVTGVYFLPLIIVWVPLDVSVRKYTPVIRCVFPQPWYSKVMTSNQTLAFRVMLGIVG